MTFGEKVKALRVRKGWVQRELADALGVSLRTVKNYELGDSRPRDRAIYSKLAEIFSVEVEDLLIESDTFSLKESGDDARLLEESLAGIKRVFRSREISQDDKDALIRTLWDLYWSAK